MGRHLVLDSHPLFPPDTSLSVCMADELYGRVRCWLLPFGRCKLKRTPANTASGICPPRIFTQNSTSLNIAQLGLHLVQTGLLSCLLQGVCTICWLCPKISAPVYDRTSSGERQQGKRLGNRKEYVTFHMALESPGQAR